MVRKSRSCTGRISGRPLTEYDSEVEAWDGGDHARLMYDRDLVPYRCRRCAKWHLAPKSRHTPSEECSWCRGRSGEAKASYRTEVDARRRADLLAADRGQWLRVYPCPHGTGWHLTKQFG
jgi:hypothetical protein